VLPARQVRIGFVAGAVCVLMLAGLVGVVASTTPAHAQSQQLDLRVLLIGQSGGDPVTEAWQNELTSEGVAYTLVLAEGSPGSETIDLPNLTDPNDSSHGLYNGVVVIPSPYDFLSYDALLPVWQYESEFNVRQLDGYVYPNSALNGLTPASSGDLSGETLNLTSAGLAAFPALQGPVPLDSGTYGYPSTVAPSGDDTVTPYLEDSDGNVLMAVDQHSDSDYNTDQFGVSELSITFDYNENFTSWLLLAPSLIDWVTDGTHLGLTRNYVETDIDDTFTPDNAWDTTTHSNDYSDADSLRMSASDVVNAAQWSEANGFRMDQLFNGGGSVEYQDNELDFPTSGPDPVLAQFQATDSATGEPYADDFGWISHTYDTPYLDVGCATQNYIEAELNENTNWAAAAPGSTAGTGGLGLSESTNSSDALGNENPDVFVPGNHSGFADLVPGTPATVDPPDLDAENVSDSGGTLAAGDYVYAVTDQFNASDSPSTDQSQAYVTAPISVPAGGSVSLVWQAICHAANYLIYREVSGSNDWYDIGSLATPPSATLPDNSSGDPVSTDDVTGGGEKELTFLDSGQAGTEEPSGWTPPTDENANELPWEQNPYFTPALQAVGITTVGADASKPYPDPPDTEFGIGTDYSGDEYPAGTSFVDGSAQVVPRHPINIFYNTSTEAQEVDEYNTLYLSVNDGGSCVDTATTTCITQPATFADIVNSVVSGMLENMLSNNPEPTYVHQTNIMGTPPPGPPTSGTPPNTPDTTGDGLLYSVLKPLLAEYNSYFTAAAPFEQPTLGAIGTILADQSAWQNALAAGSVTASAEGSVVTVTNNGSDPVSVPVSMPLGSSINNQVVGQEYGATTSGWESLAAGASLTIDTTGSAPAFTSGDTATSQTGSAFSFPVTTSGNPIPSLTESGALPQGVTFTDNGDGTGTLAGTPAAGTGGNYPITLTASNEVGSPDQQSFTLVVDQPPSITSANSTDTEVSAPLNFTVTTSGNPTSSLSESGSLPSGVSFADNGNGTATLSGTPGAGTEGSYPITITATNGVGSPAQQSFTLTVTKGAIITSPDSYTAQLGTAFSFMVTADGTPKPTFSYTGSLPSGVTFEDNGNGTATLGGTPGSDTDGDYPITITATNGVGSPAQQSFTLVVGQVPAITSAASTTFTAGTAGTFTVSTTGPPTPGLTESGSLPDGVTFEDNGNGTATLAGTPGATTGGTYPITITANNGVGSPAQQSFTLTVDQAPAFSSAASAPFSLDTEGSFYIETTGFPTATIKKTGAMPAGLTFSSEGNGTATVSGTPTKAGTYTLNLTATNTAGSATQQLTITVTGSSVSPTIKVAKSKSVKVGKDLKLPVTTKGSPTPSISESGPLPSGVTFTDHGNGTATISGTPASGTEGTYPVTLTATNSAGHASASVNIKVKS
jgi:hypothetical protein